ncbi:hypothetical protein J2S10_004284 [Neobacillus ginsengisoli]|uniref:Uncharacterized protein n=1 Tax=Neobacillus ginsengisoli TaxID=904295 RepID=A0ABT9XZT2_9BACI|nr:hypothetical protein [Neobacillus ginsengisoli]
MLAKIHQKEFGILCLKNRLQSLRAVNMEWHTIEFQYLIGLLLRSVDAGFMTPAGEKNGQVTHISPQVLEDVLTLHQV